MTTIVAPTKRERSPSAIAKANQTRQNKATPKTSPVGGKTEFQSRNDVAATLRRDIEGFFDRQSVKRTLDRDNIAPPGSKPRFVWTIIRKRLVLEPSWTFLLIDPFGIRRRVFLTDPALDTYANAIRRFTAPLPTLR